MRTRARQIALAAAVGLLVLPGLARADFQTLYDDYRVDGGIDGCEYQSGDLTGALGAIPADVREYDPGFAEALNTALEQLAAGCEEESDASSEQSAGAIAADGSPGPPRPRVVQVAGEVDSSLPAVLVAVIVVLGAALAAGVLMVAVRFFGWDPGRRLAGATTPLRRLRERLADGLWALRDRLGV